MGAYYGWVNVTKMEYLGNTPFAYSVGIMENCRFPNDRTDVALTLLAGRWHGDLVAYVSDYTNLEALEGEGFRRMAELIPENPRDYIEDNGTDVDSLFSCFKGAERYCSTDDDSDADFMHLLRGHSSRNLFSIVAWSARRARSTSTVWAAVISSQLRGHLGRRVHGDLGRR